MAIGSGPLRESPRRYAATDTATVTEAQAGSKAAFARLYEGLETRVRVAAYRLIGDAHEAEDTLQDTFLVALRSLPRLEDPAAFESWLLRIARNRALDRARSLRRCRPSGRAHDESQDRAGVLPRVVRRSGVAEPSPASIALMKATLAEMPATTRETIRLRYLRGLSCLEIAERTQLSVACVKTRLHRARAMVRDALMAGRAGDSGDP